MRITVIRFAKAMERRLNENTRKKGWNGCHAPYLLMRLKEELEELKTELSFDEAVRDRAAIRKEAVDVANFAMMIADADGDLRSLLPRPAKIQRCRICGCTDAKACPEGCSWIEPDLCSACADPVKKPKKTKILTSYFSTYARSGGRP